MTNINMEINKKFKIRLRGGYSDRNNISSIDKKIQVDNFSKDTRVVLKNRLIRYLELSRQSLQIDSYDFENRMRILLSENLFNISLNSNESNYSILINAVYEIFDNGRVNEILDIIEFTVSTLYVRDFDAERKSYSFNAKIALDLKKEFNEVFEIECIGYRFVNGYITNITDKNEIAAIEKASSTKYDKINKHMSDAVQYLSDRQSKKYLKSIEESVLAVEGLCSIYMKEKGTLGSLIDKIDKKRPLHPALKEAIKKIYGFASDEPGIRHENCKNDSSVSFEEAKLVLITCSAIINYLVALLNL